MHVADDSEHRQMAPDEAEEFVLSLLSARGPLTTMEIESLASREHRRCPDQTVLFLAKMRAKGLIEGEPSLERKGWLWSIPVDSHTPLG
jgi:hypothetical protein